MKHIRRFCSVPFSQVVQRFRFCAIGRSSERERLSVGTDIPARLGNGGEANAVLDCGGEVHGF